MLRKTRLMEQLVEIEKKAKFVKKSSDNKYSVKTAEFVIIQSMTLREELSTIILTDKDYESNEDRIKMVQSIVRSVEDVLDEILEFIIKTEE